MKSNAEETNISLLQSPESLSWLLVYGTNSVFDFMEGSGTSEHTEETILSPLLSPQSQSIYSAKAHLIQFCVCCMEGYGTLNHIFCWTHFVFVVLRLSTHLHQFCISVLTSLGFVLMKGYCALEPVLCSYSDQFFLWNMKGYLTLEPVLWLFLYQFYDCYMIAHLK